MTEIRKVKIMNLGITPYEDSLELMKELQAKRINDEIIDTLIFLQHPEIVTVGPRARNDGIKPPSNYPSFPVDRGGGSRGGHPGSVFRRGRYREFRGRNGSVQLGRALEDF